MSSGLMLGGLGLNPLELSGRVRTKTEAEIINAVKS